MEKVTHDESETKEELQKLEKAFNAVTSQPVDKSLKEVSSAEGKKVISLRGVGHSERRIAPLPSGFSKQA